MTPQSTLLNLYFYTLLSVSIGAVVLVSKLNQEKKGRAR